MTVITFDTLFRAMEGHVRKARQALRTDNRGKLREHLSDIQELAGYMEGFWERHFDKGEEHAAEARVEP